MEFQKNTSTKRNFISILFVILLLIVYLVFPVENNFQKLISQLTFFALLPILYVKFIIKEKINIFCFKKENIKKNLVFSLMGIIFAILTYIAVYRLFNPKLEILIPFIVRTKFTAYLLYELVFVPFFLLTIGYFLYGFLISEFRKATSFYVILLPSTIMTFLLVYSGFQWNQLALLLFTPVAAFIAYRTRCFWNAIISQIVYVFIIDTAILLLVR